MFHRSSNRRKLLGAPLLAAAVLVATASLAGGAPPLGIPADGVHVASTDRNVERVKLLPIGKRAGQRKRSVISLGNDRVGPIRQGDRIEGAAEVQFSVCIKPNRNHTSSRDDCVGKLYGYDPKVRGQLALAPSAGATSNKQTKSLGKAQTMTCTQSQPNRNHHCVMSLSWRGERIADPAKLPCVANGGCHLNLILSAFHKKAKRGQNVIIGGVDGSGRVEHRGKGKVSLARYRPGDMQRGNPISVSKPRKGALPLVDDGKDIKGEVVYSLPLRNARAGEAIVIEGRYGSSIGHLSHNVRTRTQVILTNSPGDIRAGGSSTAAKVADTAVAITEMNNFNCTRGRSGHRSPCPIRKVGILRIRNSTNQTLYINLVAGHGALVDSNQRFKRGSKVRVAKGGYLKAWRYDRRG